MAVEIIKVRKSNNHTATRSIKANALSIYQRRGWEPIPGQTITTSQPTQEVKKKDVEPAEAESEQVDIKPEGISEDPFAQVGEPEGKSPQEEYEALAGKAADKRWSEKRLNDEIAKLK